jgi:hypothetical protein
MAQGYPKKSIDYLTSNNNLLNTYNTDPNGGSVSYPNTINKKIVTQDANGKWVDQYVEEESPVKDPQKQKQDERDDIDSRIGSFQQTSAILDNKIIGINSTINFKKSQIVNLIATAIGAGCSFISTTGSNGAQDVGGVAIGIGSTVYSDAASISVYTNLSNYSTTNPFSPSVTSTLTLSNAGTGYTTLTVNNGGSSVGSYSSIPTTAGQHSGAPSPAACAGYGSSVISIAAELTALRTQRDLYLTNLNTLKKKTKVEELKRWGLKRSDQSIQDQKTSNQSLIDLINSQSEFQ